MDNKKRSPRKAAIRKEIKQRMQKDLDDSKKKIKRRIKGENISVEEKREKYRREAHEEKLRLMELARQEFKARKQMLGSVAEEDYEEEFEEYDDEIAEAPEPASPWQDEEEMLMDEDDAPPEPYDEVDPQEVFILEDTTEEREALRRLESPIGEYDALPAEAERFTAEPGVGTGFVDEEDEAHSLAYYIFNLILHPVATLDEFDYYLISPGGIRNVVIFYLLSILPAVAFAYVMQSVGVDIVGEITGTMPESFSAPQPNIFSIYGASVLNLVLFSLSIAAVNYLRASEANFVTLTTYLAFVSGATNIVAYALVIVAALAALVFPLLIVTVGLLLFAFFIWVIALVIIVLKNAYGYGLVSAILLAIGGWIVQKIGVLFFNALVVGLTG